MSVRTVYRCDKCGDVIEWPELTISIQENHGPHSGTMGEERHSAFHLCSQCKIPALKLLDEWFEKLP